MGLQEGASGRQVWAPLAGDGWTLGELWGCGVGSAANSLVVVAAAVEAASEAEEGLHCGHKHLPVIAAADGLHNA